MFLPLGPQAEGVLSSPASIRLSVCLSLTKGLVRAITHEIFLETFANLVGILLVGRVWTSLIMVIAAH